jgi:hypothetical protein
MEGAFCCEWGGKRKRSLGLGFEEGCRRSAWDTYLLRFLNLNTPICTGLCCMLVKRDTSLKTGEMEKRTEIFLISDKCTCVLW